MGYNRSGKKFRDRLKRHRKMIKRLSEKEAEKTAAAAAPLAKK